MSNASIVIDGASVTVTFAGTAIADVNSVAFSILGDRAEIDLSTLTNSALMTMLLSDLVDVPNVVVDKKFDPAADLAISEDNGELVIVFKIGKATTKTLTFNAQLLETSVGTLEIAPANGVNNQLTFLVTNLDASLAEDGPALT